MEDRRHPDNPARLHRPAVSIIIPARNAEATLPATLEAALAQDYDGPIEIVVADGSDTSDCVEMIGRRFPRVRIVPNPDRTTSAGLNRALHAAAHHIVVRCDAHAVLPPGYVERAVTTLARTGAASVGGRQRPVGRTAIERAVALAMTTYLGSGGARYRVGGPEGPTDTVYLGVFRRDALEVAGGFDPTLHRNQDYDLSWRLRAAGETVWFDPALAADYRPRGSLRALARQYFDYGWWKRVMLRRHPESLRTRQRAAPVLLAGLALSGLALGAGAILAAAGVPSGAAVFGAAAVVPAAYLLLILSGSAWIGVRRRSSSAVLLPAVLAVIHLSWACGFWLSGFTWGGRKPSGDRPRRSG